MTWEYLQRKKWALPYPIVKVICKSLAWSAKTVFEGCIMPELYCVYRGPELTWYAPEEHVVAARKSCSEFLKNNPEKVIEIVSVFRKRAPAFLEWVRESIVDLEGKSNDELLHLYNEFNKRYEEAYIFSEPLGWHVKDGFDTYIAEKSGMPLETVKDALIPDESFVQRMHRELMDIAAGLNKEDILKLKQGKSAAYQKIKEHHDKYFWVPYDYGVKTWDMEHFVKELLSIKDAKAEKANYASRRKEIDEAKSQLSGHLALIARAVREEAFAMDYRKELFTQAHYIFHKLLSEMAKRLELTLEDVQYIVPEEMSSFIYGQSDTSILKERKVLHIFGYEHGKFMHLTGEEAQYLLDDNLPASEEIAELRGSSAYPGMYKGRIRKVMDSREIDELKEGEILLTHMTSPDFTVGMKKAGAIITQEGGVTCHAAVVSRELKKPCIVGVKHSINTLETGDIVEVNADEGVVKKI